VRGRSILLAGAIAILLPEIAACAPAFSSRAAGVALVPRRIAVGPAVVSVFEFDRSGGLAQRADWTADAAQNIDAAIAARVAASGGRTFVAADVAHTDVPYGDFRRWSSGALQEIAGQLDGSRPSAHRAVTEWRFPQSLSTWHAALGADFVVAALFIDAYEVVAPATPAAERYRANQTGIACVVDLSDGRIVWCERARDPFGDLRTPEGARDAVAAAAAEVWPKGDRP
jgi:hypothetical protein